MHYPAVIYPYFTLIFALTHPGVGPYRPQLFAMRVGVFVPYPVILQVFPPIDVLPELLGLPPLVIRRALPFKSRRAYKQQQPLAGLHIFSGPTWTCPALLNILFRRSGPG
jgi:hypothetical protein